jgi:hypothetical protein
VLQDLHRPFTSNSKNLASLKRLLYIVIPEAETAKSISGNTLENSGLNIF